MTVFSKPRVGFRFADTRFGDSLQKIAARELGDASRWPELISYNDLVDPYITDDETEAGPGVLLSGQPILVPAPAPATTGPATQDEAFGTDLRLDGGVLATDGVDFVLVSGNDNLVQALQGRIKTERLELMFHPEYGCDVRRIIGKVNGPTKGLLTAQLVRGTVLQDPRVARVKSSTANVSGDRIVSEAEVETIAGRSLMARTNV